MPPKGNPFWSQGAQLEYEIRARRPLGLPRAELFSVPDWEFEEGERAQYELGDRRHADGPQETLQDRFKTPSSWETVSGGQSRTEGPLPTDGYGEQGVQPAKPAGRLGLRSEGQMQAEEPRFGTRVRDHGTSADAMHGGHDLEREVEREMVNHLMEQNNSLKEQVQELRQEILKRRVERERTPPPRPPPPPRPTTPRVRPGSTQKELRFTPQGIQVPLSPDDNGMCYAEVPDFPSWTQVGSSSQGGERGGVRQSEMWWSAASEDHQAMRDMTAPTPPEARAMWLERELKSLQATVEKMAGERRASGYWETPFIKMDDPAQPSSFQNDFREFREENLRSVPISIPALVAPGSANAALEAGDWLAQLRPLIGDVSMAATKCWDDLMAATNVAYNRWLSLGPLERLQVRAPTMEETSGRNVRLDQRVTMMLVNAIPQELKNELIATRELYTAGVVFKVLRTYQPGGLAEKAATLASLTGTRPAENAVDGASMLRLWRRQALRARELGVTLPDPMLQVRALDMVMSNLLRGDPQATFRVQAFRLREEVDVKPNQSTVDTLFEMLQAECDQMLHHRPELVMKQDEKPLVKAFSSPTKPGEGTPCRWWGTEYGCKAGKSCPFAHAVLEDKFGRCWVCSSKHHLKSDCPARGSPGDQSSGLVEGGDGDGVKGKGKSQALGQQGSQKGKAKGKGKKGGKNGDRSEDVSGRGTGESTGMKGQASEIKTEATPQKPVINKVEGGQEGGGGETATLVTEVTSLLRSLRVGGLEPEVQLRACHLLKLEVEGCDMVLIDGGATHCLREASSVEEWNAAERVKVMVASGEVELRRNPETNTILAPNPVQGIVPVARLVEEGYSIRWDRNTCRLEHPTHGRLEVTMCQGCPMVKKDVGERLMGEIEAAQKRRARIRSVLECGILAESSYEKQIAELTGLFPQAPHRLLERVPGEAQWDPELIPINRRMRRKLQQADKIIIDMFSGPDKGRWSALEERGIAVLQVDLLHGWNVLDPHMSGFIQSVIETGKVIGWVSGPPCRTVSACRLKDDGGTTTTTSSRRRRAVRSGRTQDWSD